MPKEIKNKRTTSKFGKGTIGCIHPQAAGCEDKPGVKIQANSIIASSIYSLTLTDKLAVAVEMKLESRHAHEYMDYPAMYADLLKAFHIGLLRFKGEKTKYDPLAYGFDLPKALSMLVFSFQTNLLPEGWEFIVAHEDGCGYCFNIYKRCTGHGFHWQAFSVKPVVKYWERKDPEMLDLYLLFIKNFKTHCQIETWMEGGFGFADPYMLEDNIQQLRDEYDADNPDLENTITINLNCIADYKKKGEAYYYLNEINKNDIISFKKLKQLLFKCNKRNSLLAWMKQALVLIEMGAGLNDFDFMGDPEFEEQDGLRYADQVAIPWDEDDYISTEHNSFLDASAQGCGVYEPTLYKSFTKHDKKVKGSFEKLQSLESWPGLLCELNILYRKVLKSYE